MEHSSNLVPHDEAAIGALLDRMGQAWARGDTRLGSGYPVRLQPVTPDVVLVHASGAVLLQRNLSQWTRDHHKTSTPT